MKLNEIFTLNENISVYHGSDNKFDTFDPTHIGTETGKLKGGWGFYFSSSEEVAAQYASGNGIIKKFNIPNGDYFNFDEVGDEQLIRSIYDELVDLDLSSEDLEEYNDEFINDRSYMDSTSNDMIYTWLGHVLGSPAKASKFLHDIGYVGTTFKDYTNPSATNYVIFDPSDIRKL